MPPARRRHQTHNRPPTVEPWHCLDRTAGSSVCRAAFQLGRDSGCNNPYNPPDFTITVEGVETGIPSVGNEYLGAKAQGQFVVVSASILNNGDKAETFFTDSMKIIDDQGRQHSYSTDAALYLEGSWVLDKINPGNTLSGKFVFDIPADSVPTKVLLEGGFLGKDVEVALN